MDPGDVSAPIESGGIVVVLKLEQRTPSSLPPMAQVLPQLEQRVQLKKMEAARRTWLDALRKTTHVEVRL
jgi:parvulin-like peptidyl-prolyl isomerase